MDIYFRINQLLIFVFCFMMQTNWQNKICSDQFTVSLILVIGDNPILSHSCFSAEVLCFWFCIYIDLTWSERYWFQVNTNATQHTHEHTHTHAHIIRKHIIRTVNMQRDIRGKGKCWPAMSTELQTLFCLPEHRQQTPGEITTLWYQTCFEVKDKDVCEGNLSRHSVR